MFLELCLMQPEGPARRVFVRAGETLQVGRLRHINQLAVPDPLLAPVHFVLFFDGAEPRVRDLNVGSQKHQTCAGECFTYDLRNARCLAGCRLNDRSANLGVYLNGQQIKESPIKHGDVLVAGSSCFQVALSDTAPEPVSATATPGKLEPAQQARLLEVLASQKLPLFALVDAARSPDLLGLLRQHSEIFYSLYDGPAGEKLDDVAPYLVQLHAQSPLTQALAIEQWGNSWGMFVWAMADFKTLRRHFRRFLMVEDARGKEMYFRFYDPRVLRVFLPTCTAQEAQDFFGPVKHFIMEAEQPNVAHVYTMTPGEMLRTDNVAL
jgi:pSer/pThr/pTyr-binding forkhead associated (FHA) protein